MHFRRFWTMFEKRCLMNVKKTYYNSMTCETSCSVNTRLVLLHSLALCTSLSIGMYGQQQDTLVDIIPQFQRRYSNINVQLDAVYRVFKIVSIFNNFSCKVGGIRRATCQGAVVVARDICNTYGTHVFPLSFDMGLSNETKISILLAALVPVQRLCHHCTRFISVRTDEMD